MAVIYDQLGRTDEALRTLDKVLEIKSRFLGPNDLGVAATLKNRGNAQLKAGRLQDAFASFDRAVQIEKAVFYDYHECIASTLKTISFILNSMGRPQEGAAALQAAQHVRQTMALHGLKLDQP